MGDRVPEWAASVWGRGGEDMRWADNEALLASLLREDAAGRAELQQFKQSEIALRVTTEVIQ